MYYTVLYVVTAIIVAHWKKTFLIARISDSQPLCESSFVTTLKLNN